MLRQSAAIAFVLLIAAPDPAFAHGGNLKGPDGSTIPRFGSAPLQGKHKPIPINDWDLWWAHNRELILLARAAPPRSTGEASRPAADSRSEAELIAKLTKDQIRLAPIPALRLGLADRFFDCRAASVIALGKILGPEGDLPRAEIVAEMRKLLGDADREVRESTYLALGLLGDPSQVSALLAVLKNDPKARELAGFGNKSLSPRQRGFAALGLGLIGAKHEPDAAAVSALAEAVRLGDDREVRVLAVLALGNLRNPASIPLLRTLATGSDAESLVQAHAISALAKLGDREIRGWLVQQGLVHQSEHVARSAALALGLLGGSEEDGIVDALILHAKSSADRSVRNWSLITLGRIGSPKAIAFLLEMVARGQPHDQTFAALALGELGTRLPDRRTEIGEALVKRWHVDRNEWNCGAYAIGLGMLGWQQAVPFMIERLKGATTPGLKAHVATALALLGAKEAAPLIRDLAKDATDPRLQEEAWRALGMLGASDEVGPLLVGAIRAKRGDLSAMGGAATGFGFRGNRVDAAALFDMLSKPDDYKDDTRAFAAVALGCRADKDEVPLLALLRANCNYLATTEGLRELMRIY